MENNTLDIALMKKDQLSKPPVSPPISYATVNSMGSHMVSMAQKKLKVFGAVVVPRPVNVVNNFLFCKKSTQGFLHNKSVFKNITMSGRSGMMGLPNKNVPVLNYLPSLPVATSLVRTFLRTVSFVFMSPLGKLFTTKGTWQNFSSPPVFTLPTTEDWFVGWGTVKLFITLFTSKGHVLQSYKI